MTQDDEVAEAALRVDLAAARDALVVLGALFVPALRSRCGAAVVDGVSSLDLARAVAWGRHPSRQTD